MHNIHYYIPLHVSDCCVTCVVVCWALCMYGECPARTSKWLKLGRDTSWLTTTKNQAHILCVSCLLFFHVFRRRYPMQRLLNVQRTTHGTHLIHSDAYKWTITWNRSMVMMMIDNFIWCCCYCCCVLNFTENCSVADRWWLGQLAFI